MFNSYFEINVSLNGRHYFATHPRSIQYQSDLVKICADFEKRFPVHDAENEDEQLGEISLETIAKGEQLLADKHLQHLCDILTDGGWDANTADVWFQYCTLGEIVYG